MRNRGEYAGYVVFGAGVIDYLLEGLITAYVHAINYNLRRMEEIYPNSYLYDLEVRGERKPTPGKSLATLRDLFSFQENYPDIYDRIDKLIQKRNDVAHKLIKDYGGDLTKMNSDFKSYSESSPIETCLGDILQVQAEIATDTVSKPLERFNEPIA